ncbi:ribosome-inactivating family protein [Sphingomonas sp. HF-S3]|uniref:Ribosome-inactivating family protein n=1 Tax=Sphingomonas rustica TaxID=3103142 RepID=A0ABV0B673_9SPHN
MKLHTVILANAARLSFRAAAATFGVSTLCLSPTAQADVAPNTVRNVTITFDDSITDNTRRSYEDGLNQIRIASGHYYNDRMFITQNQDTNNHGLIRVNLVRRSDNRYVILWLRPYDLYVLGYTAYDRVAGAEGRNGNRTAAFRDSGLRSALLRSGQQWALDTSYEMGTTGSYASLAAPLNGAFPPSTGRATQVISYASFRAHFESLDRSMQTAVSHGAGVVNPRPALQFMIGLLSESARLYDVRGQFSAAFASTAYNHPLGQLQISLENDWDVISTWTRDRANGTPRGTLLTGSGNYNTFDDVRARLAIIRGFKPPR